MDLGFAADRNDHRNGLFISTILIAMRVDEIFLFELDRDEDVCSRSDSEDEMSDGHDRRGEVDLAAQVLQTATFLAPADRQVTTSKVIAYSRAKDKALVEILVNRGPLSQEWYHVVVRRVERGWTTFSITQVAIS